MKKFYLLFVLPMLMLTGACKKETIKLACEDYVYHTSEELKSLVDTNLFNNEVPTVKRISIPLDSIIRYITDTNWTWADSNNLVLSYTTEINLNQKRFVGTVTTHDKYPDKKEYERDPSIAPFLVEERLSAYDIQGNRIKYNDCGDSFQSIASSSYIENIILFTDRIHTFFPNAPRSETRFRYKHYHTPIEALNFWDEVPNKVFSTIELKISRSYRFREDYYFSIGKPGRQELHDLLKSIDLYVIHYREEGFNINHRSTAHLMDQ